MDELHLIKKTIMKVYTDDINQLLNSAIYKHQKKSGKDLAQSKYSEFFSELCESIHLETGTTINADTLYKQFYIRMKSWDRSEIGFSVDYLNCLSQYVHKKDYNDVFKVVFEDENEIPEFPWEHPAFPATPTIKIHCDDYKNLWVKDESHNPTGVCKDRFAWEVFLYYRSLMKDIIIKKKDVKFPRLSLISSGNAALSIQNILRIHGLPNLKVIVDKKFIDDGVYLALKNSGCEIFPYNLESKRLTSEDILKETNNRDGKDLTYGYDIEKLSYYDWMAYEILNLNPQYCFVPFGSGDLMKNIMEINHKELMSKRSSKRFFGNKEILQKCKFFGARAENKNTRMKMLYAKFNTLNKKEDFRYFFDKGTCSKESDIVFVNEKEKYLDKALLVAKKNGITCEASGIAGLALLFQLRDEEKINPEEKIIIVNTGKINLKLFDGN